jgi:3-methyladenine DNA glycosylase AlkC
MRPEDNILESLHNNPALYWPHLSALLGQVYSAAESASAEEMSIKSTTSRRPNTLISGRQREPYLPPAPRSIQKGSSLADLLDKPAIEALVHNISLVHRRFKGDAFRRAALTGLGPLALLQRGQHLARVLRAHLPTRYEDAVDILIRSLTPPSKPSDEHGLAVFFYLPHVSFVALFGLDAAENGGRDPFEVSMRAQYEFTRRFSSEFSMRPFLIRYPERTLARLIEWTRDGDYHVRRLCSEGARPRLPWAVQIPALVTDPRPALPILEALKDDPELYVRRSVANHLGDIAKDHPAIVFKLCETWLKDASTERKWLIRHALRHPARKGVKRALQLRKRAK